eukprot:1092237-Rhodomonas_salina.2
MHTGSSSLSARRALQQARDAQATLATDFEPFKFRVIQVQPQPQYMTQCQRFPADGVPWPGSRTGTATARARASLRVTGSLRLPLAVTE